MAKIGASIDIGTYTARLLIAGQDKSGGGLRPLRRRRGYIRLSERAQGKAPGTIEPAAIERTLQLLKEFRRDLRECGVSSVHAVATGVIREASNGTRLLERIRRHTGIGVRRISGDEEARLSAKGVLQACDIGAAPCLIFDLGGGSTEFFSGSLDDPRMRSVALGATVLTDNYLPDDPPEAAQLEALAGHIENTLGAMNFTAGDKAHPPRLVGTGGTVATLAAMVHGLCPAEIDPARINGLFIKRSQIDEWFARLRSRDISARARSAALEPERARVILAGALVVTKILQHYGASRMMVSMGDLLEGLLLDWFEGENNEQ